MGEPETRNMRPFAHLLSDGVRASAPPLLGGQELLQGFRESLVGVQFPYLAPSVARLPVSASNSLRMPAISTASASGATLEAFAPVS